MNMTDERIKREAEFYAVEKYKAIKCLYDENSDEFIRHLINKLSELRAGGIEE